MDKISSPDTNSYGLLLVKAYNEFSDSSKLLDIYRFLLPVTRSVIFRVLEKLHLSYDLKEDMEQDAFIKLVLAIRWFDPNRSPNLRAYWKTSLYNHLISKYYSNHHKIPLDVEFIHVSHEPVCEREILGMLKEALRWDIIRWRKAEDRIIAFALLRYRLFAMPDEEKSQFELASMLNLSQGYLSHWEDWLRHRLKKHSNRLFGDDIMP
jgi:DNA-directed RNA polymerase specialized sigma24 family protein